MFDGYLFKLRKTIDLPRFLIIAAKVTEEEGIICI